MIVKNIVLVLGALMLVVSGGKGFAQDTSESVHAPMSETSAAKPEDVASVDAIISAVYDVISGPAGPRDWGRMRSLFTPEARLAVRSVNAPDGIQFLSLDDYEKNAGAAFMKTGFFETGIHNETVHYDSIAHVFSTYESRRTVDGEPFARGINSIQLLHHQDRWWVVSIYWQAETEDAPIPTHFLPKPGPKAE